MYLRIGGSAVDEGVLLPHPSVGGLCRCPRGLDAGEEFACATDGSAFTGSQEVQIIAVDRPGNQWLVTRSGLLVDGAPWHSGHLAPQQNEPDSFRRIQTQGVGASIPSAPSNPVDCDGGRAAAASRAG